MGKPTADLARKELLESQAHRERNLSVDQAMEQRWRDAHNAPVTPGVAHSRFDAPGYEKLREVLEMAYNQSAHGKGRERHANERPFDRQPIMEHGHITGPAGTAFQVMKKAGEAMGMAERGEPQKAIQEMLGAIVYAAATVLLLEEKQKQ